MARELRSRSQSSSRTDSRSSSGSAAHDDSEGLIHIERGEMIRDRYRVMGTLGQGTFGTVLDCLDLKYNERIAVKVVRSVKRYLQAAETEVDILEKIKRADPDRNSLCVRLYGCFEFTYRSQRHFCIGTERLGRSLYDFIKKNDYRGFRIEHVREFAKQLVRAVGFCHSIRLIHTDLKPENILLVDDTYRFSAAPGQHTYRIPLKPEIRLIDFGGATWENDHHSTIINTRQYRSPEVLLGVGWSYPSDMWSIGCILAELFTGQLLFNTHQDLEHLALMEKILESTLPATLTNAALRPYLAQSSSSNRSRDRHAQGSEFRRSRSRSRRSRSRSPSRRRHSESRSRSRRWSRSLSPSLSPESRPARSSSKPRADLLLHKRDGTLRWPNGASSDSRKRVDRARTLKQQFGHVPLFLEFLRKLLTYDPAARITAKEALQHPFVKEA